MGINVCEFELQVCLFGVFFCLCVCVGVCVCVCVSTRHERKQWHYSQCTAGNTRENDSAFHGHKELVSDCSLKNTMTFKGMFLKIRVTLASEEVSWEKLTMATDGGANMYSSKNGVVESICEEIMQMSSEN
jgi:hypothetical protein